MKTWTGIFVAMALLAGQLDAQTAQTPEAAAQETWPLELVDPGYSNAPADLMLPMPCGATMAFQKVTVPVDGDDPLADRRVRLGQSLDQTGYSDYLRPAFLRGPFGEPGTEATHYFIARYELTTGQYRALKGDCRDPERQDRLAQGGLSWLDAVQIAQTYSEWLYTNAADALPRSGQATGFVRLPTGPEWEFAARGGARIDASLFAGLTYFGDAQMRDHALYQAAGSGRGKLGPIGLRKPNPLGLYDVYGNAEELMLEPFRLNAIGRLGGQVGGVVTRGGSVLSIEADIYSAQRTEYPPYDQRTGKQLRGETFGLRLVLGSHITTSDAKLRDIRARWLALAGAPEDPERDIDPSATLSALITAETDPRREQALSDLQLEFRRARDRAQTALQQSARATLLAGAVFVQTLNTNHARIIDKAASIRMLVDLQRAGNKSAVFNRQVLSHLRQIGNMRHRQSTYLLTYRAALETLSVDMTSELREVAYGVLREELALSGQADLLIMLDRFWGDLKIYRKQPDIDADGLMKVALN
jgi:hypothetical protein